MIREPTVLVLGAGASKPYDLPLGGELVYHILMELPSEQGALWDTLRSLEFRPKDLAAFATDLSGCGLRSIDAFLEGNTETNIRIGRAAIAHTVLWFERRDYLFKPREGRHWYESLWNLMRLGRNPNSLRKNRLSVVTFNYECSFEHYMIRVIKHAFRLSDEQAREVFEESIPVVHLHGEVGEPEDFGRHSKPLSPEIVQDAAQRIRVVHDEMAADDSRFEQAREFLRLAQRVAFVGFSFHPTNIARLRLKECTIGPDAVGKQLICASAFKMGKGDVERAKVELDVGIEFGSPNDDAYEFLRQTTAIL